MSTDSRERFSREPDTASAFAALWPRLAEAAGLEAASIRFDPAGQPYNWLGELARVVERRPPEAAKPVFEIVEDALAMASADLRALLIVGFLEDLQNLILNHGGRLEDWVTLVGPETRRGWVALIEVWQGRMEPGAFNAFVAHGG